MIISRLTFIQMVKINLRLLNRSTKRKIKI